MLKEYVLRDQLIYGQITAAQLETALADRSTLGALYSVCARELLFFDCMLCAPARAVLLGSATARDVALKTPFIKALLWSSRAVLDAVLDDETSRARLLALQGSSGITVTKSGRTLPGKALVTTFTQSYLSNELSVVIADRNGSGGIGPLTMPVTGTVTGEATTMPVKITGNNMTVAKDDPLSGEGESPITITITMTALSLEM